MSSEENQKIKIKEYINFDNMIPLKIIGVMRFEGQLFALI